MELITDHAFADKRMELALEVVAWLQSMDREARGDPRPRRSWRRVIPVPLPAQRQPPGQTPGASPPPRER
jgi:hypothetical protein